MPELPEVEYARRQLERWMERKKIVAAEAERTRVIGARTPQAFAATVKGARVESVERRGKNLLLSLTRNREELGLRLHLGMTGKFARRKKGAEPPRFSRVRFVMDDGGVVHFCDMRLFGQAEAGGLAALRESAFGRLGPDPLHEDVGADTLAGALGRTKRPLKIALMDQALIAGLGNIHVAEALWRAKLSPFRRADRLKKEELTRLAKAIRKTIDYALDSEEDEDEIEYVEEGGENPFFVYDRAGEKCSQCRKGTIRKKTQGGRTTYWCDRCQK